MDRRRPRLDRLCLVLDGSKALFARTLFFVHSIFAVWAVTCSTGNELLWTLLVIQGVFLAETVYSIYKRKGREPKWFSPCILLYLMTVAPPVWLINMRMFDCLHLRLLTNETCAGFTGDTYVCHFASIYQVMDQKTLVYTVEQLMLLLLIIGRWMLPKGDVSREQLSQLLLVNFTMAFDIMELFVLYEEPAVLRQYSVQYCILVLWTVSVLQYSLVLTSTRTKRPRLSLDPEGLKLQLIACCQSELWSMSINIIMQDGPFLALRLYCLIGLKVFSYNLLFYTSKNVLVIFLQLYRISVLVCQCREELDEHRQDIQASMALTSSASDVRQPGRPLVIASRPQLYTIDKVGKLRLNPELSHGVSMDTVDSRDLNFVTSV